MPKQISSLQLDTLCAMLDIPDVVTAAVLDLAEREDVAAAAKHAPRLMDRAGWPEAVEEIAAALAPDPDGLKMLAYMLRRVVESHERYRARGIGDDVFVATFKFCTRFLADHYRTYGQYAFVWGWWLPRQIALEEFRFGELEYELIAEAGTRRVSLHIPDDAVLQAEALRQSVVIARSEIGRLAPDFADAPWICDSWLLSPVLRDLLPAHANIMVFQSGFTITAVDPENRHAIRWIWGRDDQPIDALPERTSLQRKTKSLLLAGGNIGAAIGRMKDDAWAARSA